VVVRERRKRMKRGIYSVVGKEYRIRRMRRALLSTVMLETVVE